MERAVLLHGMGGSPDLLMPLAAELNKRGWSCEVPDLYAGRVNGCSFADYVKVAKSTMRHRGANGHKPPVVIGHSMGGLIGQLIAAEGLAKKLVLLCSAPPGKIPLVNLDLVPFLIGNMVEIAWGREFSITRAQADALILNCVRPEDRQKVYESLRPDSGRVARELLFGVPVGTVSCPVLCFIAGRDKMIPEAVSRRIAEHYRATKVTMPDAGHLLPYERPARVANRIHHWEESTAIAPA